MTDHEPMHSHAGRRCRPAFPFQALALALLLLLAAHPFAPPAAAQEESCRYDVVADGLVDAQDLQRIATGWRGLAHDYDGDGQTTIFDVLHAGRFWGTRCAAHEPDLNRLHVGAWSSYWGDWAWQNGYAWCVDDNTRTGCRSLDEATALARSQGYDFLNLSEDARYTDAPGGATWAGMQAAADRATEPGRFVAFRGFEAAGGQPSYNHEGHLMVYGLEHYTRAQALIADYYPWLVSRPEPAFAMVNHPRKDPDCAPTDRSCVDWELSDWEYQPAVDDRVELIQLDPAFSYNAADATQSVFVRALESNWHLGASGWGYARQPLLDTGNRRYGLFASALTREGVLEAMAARRTFGTDRNGGAAIAFWANGAFMGQDVAAAPSVSTTVRFKDFLSRPVAKLEIVEGGACGARVVATRTQTGSDLTWESIVPRQGSWYFARALDSSGALVAWSSPVWTTRQAQERGRFTPRPATAVRTLDRWQPGATLHEGSVRAEVRTIVLRFALADLPPGTQIRGALLSLRTTTRSDERTDLWLTAHALNRAWDPATVTWQQAASGQPWQSPGALGSADRAPLPEDTTRTQKATATSGGGRRYYWDLTDLAQRWVDHPAQNFGLTLTACQRSGGSGIRHAFDEATLWLDVAP